MPLYRLGWGSHEESDEVSLEHDDTFTDAQVFDLMRGAYVVVAKRIVAKESRDYPTIGNMFGSVVEYLCSHNGFRRLQYTKTLFLSGWSHAFDPEHGFCEDDEDTSRIIDAIIDATDHIEHENECGERKLVRRGKA